MSPEICKAAEAMRVLFDVMVSYTSPARRADDPPIVLVFIYGENHLRAADALIINQKGAAAMKAMDYGPTGHSVVSIKLPLEPNHANHS